MQAGDIIVLVQGIYLLYQINYAFLEMDCNVITGQIQKCFQRRNKWGFLKFLNINKK